MSIRVMDLVWKRSKLDRSRLLVLLAVADNANDQGIAWPSIETLTIKARIGERWLHRCLKECIDSGELKVLKSGGGKKASIYQVNLRQLAQQPPVRPGDEDGLAMAEDAQKVEMEAKVRDGQETIPEKPGMVRRPSQEWLGDHPRNGQETILTVKEPSKNRHHIDGDSEPASEEPNPDSSIDGIDASQWFDQHTPSQIESPKGRTADDIRAGVADALTHGSSRDWQIKKSMVDLFYLNPNWETKRWKSFLAWLKQVPEGQTLEAFAEWWKTEDWRGKTGQPPTPDQIMELWLQAFKPTQLGFGLGSGKDASDVDIHFDNL